MNQHKSIGPILSTPLKIIVCTPCHFHSSNSTKYTEAHIETKPQKQAACMTIRALLCINRKNISQHQHSNCIWHKIQDFSIDVKVLTENGCVCVRVFALQVQKGR